MTLIGRLQRVWIFLFMPSWQRSSAEMQIFENDGLTLKEPWKRLGEASITMQKAMRETYSINQTCHILRENRKRFNVQTFQEREDETKTEGSLQKA